ncbi:hypothetical protein ISN76_09230 [Dyella halodurans]|uniref:Uncharacterized protein n=1 Tax=Dyella halodurans TaxID=1920171 RepID=A0ABV9C1P2_9GAMM|nr:hypothetical protein [Dyella halodurans]
MADFVRQRSSMALSPAILPLVQRPAAGNQRRPIEPLRQGIDLGRDVLVHPAVKGMA